MGRTAKQEQEKQESPAPEAPRRVESSLLVTVPFTDARGREYRPCDRVSLGSRSIRQEASAHPGHFVVEHETMPFDPAADWFRDIEEMHEQCYREAKAHRDSAEERREQALRDELADQERGQPELERRFEEQEREREERRKRAREQQEREQIENDLELSRLQTGFHTDH